MSAFAPLFREKRTSWRRPRLCVDPNDGRGEIMKQRGWLATTFLASVAAYAVLIYWSS
jgi:hypothetical protein